MAQRTCSINGCDKPHRAKGYCGSHYNKILAPDRHLTTKQCAECGATYTTTRTNGRYCSLKCRDAEANRQAIERRQQRVAERQRKKAALAQSKRTCQHCTSTFTPKVTEQRYCTKQCTYRAWDIARIRAQGGRPASEWEAMDRACAHCGQIFHSPSPQARHCNSTCRRRDAARRGAHANGSDWITPTRRARIYARDNYTCWLYDGKVDMGADPRRSDWGPSLDHVVPRAQGGHDNDDNLRTAHRWCNAVRSDSDPFNMFAQAL